MCIYTGSMNTARKPRPKQRKKPGPPSRGGKTPLFAFRLSRDLVARIDARAIIDGTDRTAVIRAAAEKYLADFPQKVAENRVSGKKSGIR